MKNKIITQTTNIKKKLFSNKKRITLSTLTFLLIGGIILFGANYFAKGATYGWLQSTWSGGADTNAVADHTNNQSNWTKYFSKDDNVDTSNNELTLSSGSETVEDTTTGDFDAGDFNGPINTSGDQLTARAGYDATGICGDFEVLPTDRSGTANWATAMSYCDNLCSTCDLPNKTELACMCSHKTSFGNNFVASYYWSATEYNSSYAYYVNFSDCRTDHDLSKSFGGYVRCVRR